MKNYTNEQIKYLAEDIVNQIDEISEEDIKFCKRLEDFDNRDFEDLLENRNFQNDVERRNVDRLCDYLIELEAWYKYIIEESKQAYNDNY